MPITAFPAHKLNCDELTHILPVEVYEASEEKTKNSFNNHVTNLNVDPCRNNFKNEKNALYDNI